MKPNLAPNARNRLMMAGLVMVGRHEVRPFEQTGVRWHNGHGNACREERATPFERDSLSPDWPSRLPFFTFHSG